jgi:cation diffusion facilitator CzcD-associated flavoprotein CzcO
LCPKDHPYGTKRATFETNYYEAFNLPHVHLIARTTPIVQITENGIATTAHEYEVEVIVLATGFDVGAGGLARTGVVGRGRPQADRPLRAGLDQR